MPIIEKQGTLTHDSFQHQEQVPLIPLHACVDASNTLPACMQMLWVRALHQAAVSRPELLARLQAAGG